MAIKMVREPSETSNISNIDDIIPFRYAYGDQDGYVLGRGTEISNTINGLNFTINSGRLVVQGVECDIDATGVTVTIDNIATKRYYTVYLQVNLGLNTATILATSDTATYPNPPVSDDLTENSTGTAYLVLYHFSAQSGVISEVEKIVQGIQYTGSALNNYDISKGTVEERLTNLGFKQGSVELEPSYTATTNILKRQGNYVIGELLNINGLTDVLSGNANFTIGTIPDNFLPKETVTFGALGFIQILGTTSFQAILPIITFNHNTKTITVEIGGDVGSGANGYLSINAIRFGYEADPIE